jgi:MYXO-CTERM domain-containing protein
MGDHEHCHSVVIVTSDLMSAHKTVSGWAFPPTSLIPLLLAGWLSFGLSSVAAAAPPAAGVRMAPTGSAGGAGPEEEACGGRSIGDACSLPNRQLGTCKAGTCNRLDYSGGSPPKAIEEACVVCQPGAGHGGPPSLGSGGAPPNSGGDGGADGGADEGDASESTPASTGKEPPQSSSRCSADPDGGGLGTLGLLGLLGMLGFVGSSIRRRRDA